MSCARIVQGIVALLALGLTFGCASGPRAAVVGGRGQRVAVARRHAMVSPFAAEWFIQAERLSAQGERATAIEAYRMALASADDDAFVRAQLARALAADGQGPAADRLLAEGLVMDPRGEALWLARGDIARDRGDLSEASIAYDRAAAAAESSPAGGLAQSALLASAGAHARAIAVLERLGSRFPERTIGALRSWVELALAGQDEVALIARLSAYRRVAVDGSLIERCAQWFLARGRPALAQFALSLLPQTEVPSALRLRIALALGQPDEAEAALAGGALSRSADALDRAEVYLALRLPDRAFEELGRGSESATSDPYRRELLLGQAEAARGNVGRAALIWARIPVASAHHAAAMVALRNVLASHELPAFAGELGRSQ